MGSSRYARVKRAFDPEFARIVLFTESPSLKKTWAANSQAREGNPGLITLQIYVVSCLHGHFSMVLELRRRRLLKQETRVGVHQVRIVARRPIAHAGAAQQSHEDDRHAPSQSRVAYASIPAVRHVSQCEMNFFEHGKQRKRWQRMERRIRALQRSPYGLHSSVSREEPLN